ncbi:MAG: DUF1799 domain-containing protein [Burkholderiaceae bacterium]
MALVPDTAAEPEFELWSEHEAVVHLFVDCMTQWRIGMVGATGLDYAVLPCLFELHGVAPPARARLFSDLRVMENAALALFAERRAVT